MQFMPSAMSTSEIEGAPSKYNFVLDADGAWIVISNSDTHGYALSISSNKNSFKFSKPMENQHKSTKLIQIWIKVN